MYSIIGANGFLGSYIRKAILNLTNEDIVSVDLNKYEDNDKRIKNIQCDITKKDDVDNLLNYLSKYNNLKIIYLAAYHNPDLVEKNKELAWNTNVLSLEYFINKADFATKIYYASTDSVYGESLNKYHFKEFDKLNPVNYYGENKVAAERIMVNNKRNVVRFPFLIGPSLTNKLHFYDEIVNSLKNKQEIEMYEDSYRSSLSFENASRLLIELIENNNDTLIINICGDDDLSKYDVGLMIAKKEGSNSEYIVPITMNKRIDGFQTKRATSTLMDNSLLKKILNIEYIDIFEKPRYKK